jgi:hypothetical protein
MPVLKKNKGIIPEQNFLGEMATDKSLTSAPEGTKSEVVVPIKFTRAWEHNQDKWKPIGLEDLGSINFKDILTGKVRCIVEAKVDNKTYIFVAFEQDIEPLKKKYPFASIIPIKNILNIFKAPTIISDGWNELMPIVFRCFDYFPGISVC